MQEGADYRIYGENWFSRRGDEVVLFGSRCVDCGMHWFPVKSICPNCLSEQLEKKELSRVGVVYSCTKLHVTSRRFSPPLWIAYVDFPEGVRVCGQIEADKVECGSNVEVIYGIIRRDGDDVPVYSYKFKLVS